MTTTPQVYEAIRKVSDILKEKGIEKGRKNLQQGYAFRGIDDVYFALAPALVESNLVMLPRIIDRQETERKTQKGTPLFYVTIHAEYDLVCTTDGSKHTISTYGEAMDSADKATNKAMSAAYKYAAIQAFAIPVEGESPDADAVTHDLAPNSAKFTAPTPRSAPAATATTYTPGLDGNPTEEGDTSFDTATFPNLITASQRKFFYTIMSSKYKLKNETIKWIMQKYANVDSTTLLTQPNMDAILTACADPKTLEQLKMDYEAVHG